MSTTSCNCPAEGKHDSGGTRRFSVSNQQETVLLKILIAADGSGHAARAVDTVGAMVGKAAVRARAQGLKLAEPARAYGVIANEIARVAKELRVIHQSPVPVLLVRQAPAWQRCSARRGPAMSHEKYHQPNKHGRGQQSFQKQK